MDCVFLKVGITVNFKFIHIWNNAFFVRVPRLFSHKLLMWLKWFFILFFFLRITEKPDAEKSGYFYSFFMLPSWIPSLTDSFENVTAHVQVDSTDFLPIYHIPKTSDAQHSHSSGRTSSVLLQHGGYGWWKFAQKHVHHFMPRFCHL